MIRTLRIWHLNARQSNLFKILKLDYNFLDLLDELDSEELDDLSVIDKAAYLTTSVYDLLQQNYDVSFCRISFPDHLRFYLFKKLATYSFLL